MQDVAVNQRALLGEGNAARHPAEVREEEARRVAQLAHLVARVLHDQWADRNVARVVRLGGPPAQDVGAERRDALFRVAIQEGVGGDDVAERLGHLAAVLIHGEAMGEQAAVRRVAIDGGAGQQRGMEPAAMLVRAFQIDVGWPFHVRAIFQREGVRRT